MRTTAVLAALALSVPLAIAPAAPARAAGCTTYAPGTTVAPSRATQVMVADRLSGTTGSWRRWEWRGANRGCWVGVDGASSTRFGYGGVVPAAVRRQDTGTTPAGAFGIVFAFGQGNPGTRLPYRVIHNRSVWVNQPGQADYNRWREDGPLRPGDLGEDLSYYRDRGFYRQAAVISYNYQRPVQRGAGSGAGIFLHWSQVPTAGCVGLTSMAELTRTLRWLDPARRPVIVIKG